MPSLHAFRNVDRFTATTLFAGPVALWLRAEIAVLHGRGPCAHELLGW